MTLAKAEESLGTKSLLPQGWRWERLEQVCQDSLEVRNPSQDPEQTFIYVDISSVDAKSKQIVGAKQLLGKDAPSRARKVINAKDVIVATTRPNLNAVAIVPESLHNQICSTGFCVLRADVELNPTYLFFFVQTSEFVENLSNLVKGALYPAVTDNQVKSQSIPFPPTLAEQERMARILNEQMVAVEKARAAAEARLEAAKALQSAYLCQVFPKPDQELPLGWRWVRLGDVCVRITNGTTKPQNTERLGLPATRIETISSGFIDMDRVGWVEVSDDDIMKYSLEKGDILFSHINSVERLGNCAIFTGNETLIHGMNLLRLQVNRAETDPLFLLYFLRSAQAIHFCRDNARRAIGQASLNNKDLTVLNIPFPTTLTEQKCIASLLGEEMAALEKVVRIIQKELETINALPAALLRRAFTGGM